MENILSELAISTIKVNDYLSSYKIVDVMNVFVFEQVWGSTALGFGGWGGSTMTSEWTHVVATYEGVFIVFFNGRYAYTVVSATEVFKEDLAKQDMKSVDEALKLYS